MGEVAKTDWLVIWTAVYAIATVVLAGGVILAFLQIREARRSTQAQIAMALFRELRDKKTMRQLRNVIYKLPDDYTEARNQYEEEIIEHLISRFNFLGILVEKGIVDSDLTVDAYAGTTSLRCWYKLHKYIEKARCDRGYFAENFEWYARLSLDHFKGRDIIYKKSEEAKGVNLVTELQNEKYHLRSSKDIKGAAKSSKNWRSGKQK